MEYSLGNSNSVDAASSSSQLAFPQLHVPPVPNMVAVPAPKPVKRLPPVGYDMRTLRKQMETLYNEIDERANWQNIIYEQNEELVQYTGTLLQANKANVASMKAQMQRLHAECVALHKERMQLVEKLTNIQNAQQLINSIGDEVNRINNGTNSDSVHVNANDNIRAEGDAPFPSQTPVSGLTVTNSMPPPTVIQNISTRDMNILRFKATEAIENTRREKEELEYELKDKADKLAHMKHQLDEYRESLVDQQNDDRADTHFATSDTILRGAYARFRAAIKDRLKHHHIGNVISSVDNSILRRKYWHMWEFYMQKRMMMHHHVRRRQQALVLMMWEQWRLYTVLELHVKRHGRRNILMRYFRSWKEDLARHTEIISVSRNSIVSAAVGIQLGRQGAIKGVKGVHQIRVGSLGNRSIGSIGSGGGGSDNDGWIVVHKTVGFYDNVVSLFQERSLKRKLFAMWRKICVDSGRLWPGNSNQGISSSAAYLAWDNEELRQLEMEVQPLLVKKRTLFKHWARIAKASSQYFSVELTGFRIPHIRMKMFFRAWRSSCIYLWSFRSKLLYRFFSFATIRIQQVRRQRRGIAYGISFHADTGMRKCLRTWNNYARKRVQYRGGQSLNNASISSRFGATVNNSIGSGQLNSTRYLRRDVQQFDTGTELSASTGGIDAMLAASELSSSYFPIHHSGNSSPETPFQSPSSEGRLNTVTFGNLGFGPPMTPAGMNMFASKSAPSLLSSVSRTTTGLVSASATHSCIRSRELSFRNIKLMKQALRSWHTRIIVYERRRSTNIQLADRYRRQVQMVIKGLHVWREHVGNEIKYRRRITKRLFDECFKLWQEYTRQIRREKGCIHKMNCYRDKISRKNIIMCWKHWRVYNSYHRRCIRTADIVGSRYHLSVLRLAFVKAWKQQWCHNTFWKVGELRIENKRIQDLIALYNDELALADKEKENLVTASNDYQQQIVEYTQQLMDKEYALREQEAKNQQYAQKIQELKEKLDQRTSDLQEKQDERNRLVVAEELLADDIRQQDALMAKRKTEADAAIAQLQDGTQSLGAEVYADGELVYSLEATLKQSQEQEARVLQQLEEYTEQLREEECKKQDTLDQLHSLKSKMERELSSISTRVRAVNSSNPVSPDNGARESVDDLIRQNKASHLQYLEEQVRQYDVSIMSTANIIREKKVELAQLQQQARDREENRELSELQRYRSNVMGGNGGNLGGVMSTLDLGGSDSFVADDVSSVHGSESMGVSAWLRPSNIGGGGAAAASSSVRSSPSDARHILRAYMTSRGSPTTIPVSTNSKNPSPAVAAMSTDRQSQNSFPWHGSGGSAGGGSLGRQELGRVSRVDGSPSVDSEQYSEAFASADNDSQEDIEFSSASSRDPVQESMNSEAAKSYREAKVSLRRVTERLGGVPMSDRAIGSSSWRRGRGDSSSRGSTSSRSDSNDSDDSV